MIIGIKKQIIPETVISKKLCISVMAMCRLIFRKTVKTSLNHRSSKNIKIQSLRAWKVISMYAEGMNTNDIESHMC